MDRLTDISSLANVDTGSMIRCSDCNKPKIVGRFSKNQVAKYRAAIVSGRRTGKEPQLPRCIPCTAGNVEELYCTWCGISRPVAEFSSRHRKNPDEAKCTGCQQENDDREPDLQAATQEEAILDEYTNRQGAFSNLSSMASDLPSISGRASENGSFPASGTGILPPTDKGFGGATGFRPPSPTSSEMTNSSQFLATSTVASSAQGPGSGHSHSGNSDRFVKQGAYRPTVREKALHRWARTERQQQKSQALMPVNHQDGGKDSDDDDWEL